MEPFTAQDGTVYELETSGKSATGYKNVVEPREGQFHAKPTVDGKQVTLPGPACKTAQEAAVRLAVYKASPYPIVKQNPDRAARGEGHVRRRAHAQTDRAPIRVPLCQCCAEKAQGLRGGCERVH